MVYRAILTLAGSILLLTLLVYIVPNNVKLAGGTASVFEGRQQTRLGLPLRLKIPVINVDTLIENGGVTSDGSMEAPRVPENVVWYSLGPRPGENGTAVIAGHFGWKDDVPSVFDNLSKLSKGDLLYVENDAGITTMFVVRDVKTYDSNADTSEVFTSSDGKSHLNLITCEGTWDTISKSYPRRLVVFTDSQ